jgi:phosphoglycolate phosphatase
MDFSGPDWKIKNIKAVIFDKDGTVIDSHIYWGAIIKARSEALTQKYGLDKKMFEKICAVMGYFLKEKKLSPRGPIALVSRERVIKILVLFFNKIKVNAKAGDIADIFNDVHKKILKDIYKYIKILPDVKRVLRQVKKRNVKIVLLTSDSVGHARAIMKHLGLIKYFNVIAGRELTKKKKATGVPAKLLCQQIETKPNETICIGDAPMDAEMGKRARLKACVAVASGQTPYADLRKETKYVIKNYTNLKIA